MSSLLPRPEEVANRAARVLEKLPVSEIEIFRSEADLPFLLDRHEEADVLLVTFPAYRPGSTEPSLWQRNIVSELEAHRLLLGADEHAYLGPARELRGLRTAVRLVEEVTADLEVEPARVICIGTSNAAVLGAMTGLSYGAGVLILGGPPLNMGTLLKQWAAGERRAGGKRRASANRLMELSRLDEGPASIEWLDGLVASLAATCPRPSRVRVLVSPEDFVFPSVNRFYEERHSFPNVDVELDLTDAPAHDQMAKEFYNHFLARAVAEELGWP